jgi:hypothetical protein
MGAWDTTAFGNDDASDWAYELMASDAPAAFIQATLALGRTGDPLESPDGSTIVAAAAVVAAACDGSSGLLPPEVADWLRGKEGKLKPLASAAVAALANVNREESELRALWAESDEFTEWNGVLENISEALRA